jgi:hypothetical protein
VEGHGQDRESGPEIGYGLGRLGNDLEIGTRNDADEETPRSAYNTYTK